MLYEKIAELLNNPAVSDVHCEEDVPLWYREDGALKQADNVALTREQISTLLLSQLPGAFEEGKPLEVQLKNRGDKDFSANISVNGYRVRGNAYYANQGHLAFALRKLNNHIPEATSLGLPENFLDVFNRSKGLFLVTGSTGSGKSTTLASVVNFINQTQRRHIITIEDPIEYEFNSQFCKISQREVGKDATSFHNALRSALRQDPDVIMVGEMRDAETVKIALDAANTGHLVLATLHTMNARQSVERMVSFYSSEEKDWAHQLISSVLVGVLSQVLVPRATGNGRVLCYEYLINTPAARQTIKDGKPAALYNVMETGSKDGHVLLNRNLIERMKQGIIDYEEALYASYDPAGLEREMTSDF